jgi:hypothetical protein
MEDPNRPYPEGFAWDEAYRQRQRVESLEAKLRDAHQVLSSASFWLISESVEGTKVVQDLRTEIRAIEDLLFFADGDRTALPE